MENTRIPLAKAAPLLGVSKSYLQDVLQDRLDKRRFPEETHARLLTAFFFKETNNRWYIAKSLLDKGVSRRNATVLFGDPKRAEEVHKKLEWLL